MAEDYSLIKFIDFMKQSSVDRPIIFNYNISKKKDFNIRTDLFIINIFNFIIPLQQQYHLHHPHCQYSHIISATSFIYNYFIYLVLLNNISLIQQFNTILQSDNYIIDIATQIDIYNIHILPRHFIDISNQDINTFSLMDNSSTRSPSSSLSSAFSFRISLPVSLSPLFINSS